MEVEIPGTSSAWQAPSVTPIFSCGTDPGFMPNDDKMVDVWIALHGDKIWDGIGNSNIRTMQTPKEQELYSLLTNLLIERAKKYGSLERP